MDDTDPDAALVERIGRGDEAASRLFVAAKLPRVTGLAARILHDRVEAEDVAQEVFFRAWRQASRWRPGGARFDTWLHKVTLNLCRDRLRRRRETTDALLPERADPGPDAATRMLEAERGRRVAEAIATLPERQREAILLVHYQDLSGGAAAAVLDISIEALESLLARGRRTLRTRFAEMDDD